MNGVYSLLMILIPLVILLAISYLNSHNNILTPEMGFSICFIPSVLYALTYVDKVDYSLRAETIFVIVFGVAIFVFVSIIFNRIYEKTHQENVVAEVGNCFFEIGRHKLVVVIIIELISLFLMLKWIHSLYGGSITSGISNVRQMTTFMDAFTEGKVYVPKITSVLRRVSITAGYISSYMIAHSLVYKYKDRRFILGIIFLLSMINAGVMGSRGEIVQMVFAFAVQYYFIWGHSINWEKGISAKFIIGAIVLVVILMYSFQYIAVLMGRESDLLDKDDMKNYIFAYLSGMIKNLDIYLQSKKLTFDGMTVFPLKGIINYISVKLNAPEIYIKNDLPFNSYRGLNLGNVYTCFYVCIHDKGGVISLLFYVSLMAIICSISFQGAFRDYNANRISINIILYSYVFYAIIFSYFGNKIYGDIVAVETLLRIVTWQLLILYLERVEIVHGGKIVIRL